MESQASIADASQERNRRLLRILLAVAALLSVGTIVYIALHRHV
jgi:hypothetical protein